MASARKLPSGAWRTLATKTINGKKIRKSFTVHPKECGGDWKKAKNQSELLARNWLFTQETEETYGLTVKIAFEKYIQERIKVISPSTIRGYNQILRSFESIWDICITDIESPQIQRIINDWSMDLKTKTIRNRVSVLLSVLDYNGVDKKIKVRYPQSNSKKVLSPDIEDVQMFIRNADEVMESVIYLAAFGSLRRGEIGGLREMDISRDMCTVSINGDMVESDDGWIYKPFPKTQGSIRTVPLPRFVIDSIPVRDNPSDFIYELTPGAMTQRFCKLANKLSLPYTLHSMRHFSASFRTDLGIPKKYVQEVGGWIGEDSAVLSRIYDNPIDSSRKHYTQIANHFIEENFKDIRERKSC